MGELRTRAYSVLITFRRDALHIALAPTGTVRSMVGLVGVMTMLPVVEIVRIHTNPKRKRGKTA